VLKPGQNKKNQNVKNKMRKMSLFLVALIFCATIGHLLCTLLQLLLVALSLPSWFAAVASTLVGAAYAVSYFSIIMRQRLCGEFIHCALLLTLLLSSFGGLGFWLALPMACIIAGPLLKQSGGQFAWLERASVIHQMHNVQTLVLLFGMGLSLRIEALRLPVLLTIASGMLHWHPALVGACPLTLLEARLTRDARKAELLARLGFFQYYLRQWSGRLVTRPQINVTIAMLISAMLGQWVLG